MQELYKALENIVWLTQLGLSMMMPLLLCLGGCWWGVTRWGWPLWVYLPAILLGLGSGWVSFYSFWKMLMKRAKESKGRQGFNRHT